ncbi:MAG: hypothetical protein LBI03_08965, partial [Clostridiales bacterium]|nr:hypothetical protein [Clostridiales bacterium]
MEFAEIIVGKDEMRELVNRIAQLADSISDSGTVTDSVGIYNEKKYLQRLVEDANELLCHGEWLIALENILDNLAKVNYKLEPGIWCFAKRASKCAPDGWTHEKLLRKVMMTRLMAVARYGDDDMQQFKFHLEKGIERV